MTDEQRTIGHELAAVCELLENAKMAVVDGAPYHWHTVRQAARQATRDLERIARKTDRIQQRHEPRKG